MSRKGSLTQNELRRLVDANQRKHKGQFPIDLPYTQQAGIINEAYKKLSSKPGTLRIFRRLFE